MFPFSEQVIDHVKIRTFKSSVEAEELVWHRDARDRNVLIVSGTGWYFQHDDCLPIELSPGMSLEIKKNTWHRVIRRDHCSDLVVEIKELD